MQYFEIINLFVNLALLLDIFCAQNCHLFSVFNSFLTIYDPIGPSFQFRPTFSSSKDPAKNIFHPLSHEQKTLRDNPFEVLDVKCVGRLMRICPPSPLRGEGKGDGKCQISLVRFQREGLFFPISLLCLARGGSPFSILFSSGIIPCPPLPWKHDEEIREEIPEESLSGSIWHPYRKIRQES